MNIGNITNTGMNLNENGKIMQIEIYEQQITQLTNNWNELEEWVSKHYIGTLGDSILDKMKEIKEVNNEKR